MTESELFGKVVEANWEFFGASVNSQTDADNALVIASPKAPARSGGFDLIDDVTYLLTYPLDALGEANKTLRTHARVAISPIVASLAKLLLSWSPHKVLTEAAKRKRLLLELWREKSGFKDELSDKTQVQKVLISFLPQQDFTKPPPNNLRLSSLWLTSATPLGVRAPNASLVR